VGSQGQRSSWKPHEGICCYWLPCVVGVNSLWQQTYTICFYLESLLILWIARPERHNRAVTVVATSRNRCTTDAPLLQRRHCSASAIGINNVASGRCKQPVASFVPLRIYGQSDAVFPPSKPSCRLLHRPQMQCTTGQGVVIC
jgi:hypothetical protein